jgi:hypothetical protein
MKISPDLIFLRTRQYIRNSGVSINLDPDRLVWRSACYQAEFSLTLAQEMIMGPDLKVSFDQNRNELIYHLGSYRDLIKIYHDFQDIKFVKKTLALV